MGFQTMGKILRTDLRRNFLPHLLAAVLIMTAFSMLMGISALSERQSARPVEMVMPIMGIILLTPVFLPEQNENIRDVIRSKKTDYIRICIMRVIYSVFFLAVLCGIFTLAMRLCESKAEFLHFIGGFTSGLFPGAVGFLFAGVSRNVIAGYMTALIYYTANHIMGRRIIFDLFTMTAAADIHSKYIPAIKLLLIAASLLIIILCFIFVKETG